MQYCSSADYNDYDIVLVSFTSYYDVLNLINEIDPQTKKTKIIVGGQGAINPALIYDLIDGMWFGRAEDRINNILEFEEFDSFWIKKQDPYLEKKYSIAPAHNLIQYKDYVEKSVGCPYKCSFCQYGWKNKLYNFKGNYSSGYTEHEDTIKNIDFNKYKRPYLVSAIDGLAEYSRMIVNKRITKEDIICKINSFYDSKTKSAAVKLYSIVGYPWETKFDISELQEILKQTDRKTEKSLNFFLICTHFAPMPYTPMENEPINWHNFRNDAIREKYNLFGDTIKFFVVATQISSPISAAEETILYRAEREHFSIVKKILTSNKYLNQRSEKKEKIIKQYFSEKLWGQNPVILPFLYRDSLFERHKRLYYERKQKWLSN